MTGRIANGPAPCEVRWGLTTCGGQSCTAIKAPGPVRPHAIFGRVSWGGTRPASSRSLREVLNNKESIFLTRVRSDPIQPPLQRRGPYDVSGLFFALETLHRCPASLAVTGLAATAWRIGIMS